MCTVAADSYLLLGKLAGTRCDPEGTGWVNGGTGTV